MHPDALSIDLAPAFEDLVFMAPLSQFRATRLVRFLADGLTGIVVDIGCGWGELLLQVVAAAPFSTGIGVDRDRESVEHGRLLAEERGLSDRVTLIAGDCKDALPDHADAVILVGASHVWNPPSDKLPPMAYEKALSEIRSRIDPGARVVYAEAIWSAPPTETAAGALGGRLDEHRSLAAVVDLAVDAGFATFGVHESNLDEWDEFESGCGACYTRWLLAHETDHPDAEEVRATARDQHDRYFRAYRGVLGFGYLELVAI
jgi:SAM-dependent methyltransferase